MVEEVLKVETLEGRYDSFSIAIIFSENWGRHTDSTIT